MTIESEKTVSRRLKLSNRLEVDMIMGTKLVEFGSRVSRYFLEFLETDFKRQQVPRRRIVLKNDADQLMAFAEAAAKFGHLAKEITRRAGI